MEAAKRYPSLVEKWVRCISGFQKLPDSAYSCEQRMWLAKVFSEHTGYSSLAMSVADGLITSRSLMLEGLAREFWIELSNEQDCAGGVASE